MDNCNHDSVGEVITLNPKADLESYLPLPANLHGAGYQVVTSWAEGLHG